MNDYSVSKVIYKSRQDDCQAKNDGLGKALFSHKSMDILDIFVWKQELSSGLADER